MIAQLIADYQAGIPTTRLTTNYDIGKGTVLRILESHDIPRCNQPMTPEQCAQVIALYQQGWSLAKVGKYFNREHSVIRDVLVRASIARRDSHGRERS